MHSAEAGCILIICKEIFFLNVKLCFVLVDPQNAESLPYLS